MNLVRVGAVSLLLGSRALAGNLEVLPADIELSGPEAFQRVLVMHFEDGILRGEAEGATLKSLNPEIATVDASNTVRPVKEGVAKLEARVGDQKKVISVSVEDMHMPHGWSFRNHILPILSRSECNMGACHGALAGKGGFRLSLDGYDPDADHFTMTREARGRRIEMASPAHSLILTKATTAARHKGGKRIDTRSRDYRILAEWVANGAAAPTNTDATLEELEILPELTLLQPGDTQNIIVRAHYSDGRTEDVTSWARYTSTDETVASVDPETSEISVIGHGEGAITAWFSSQIVLARVISPFPNDLPKTIFAEAPRRNFVDEHVLTQLERLNLKPSPRTQDGEFIRRAYVDTIGRLPSVEETRDFLQSMVPNKRDQLIESLLEREEFVDYWTYRWSDIFLINGQILRPDAVKSYYEWIRGEVEKGTPWDEIVDQVVTASGDSMENGATNFFAVHQDPETMAENVSQAFMSLSINCAKCHNHPLEKWTNDQYYSFANLFSRVRAKGWGGDPRNGDGVRTLYTEVRGDLIQPRTGQPQPPAPLDAPPMTEDDERDRRDVLAEWLTSPENPYFTRSITNRVWAAFFGIGLVEPVDDLRVSNPASNEALLNALSDHVVEHDYDLKALMRTILQSETYQRSSQPLPENREEDRYYSRYYPRRMMAEVLEDAVSDITAVSSTYANVVNRDGSTVKTELYPEGTRALELYDSAVESYFLKTFGRNERAITCDCERSNQPSMVQVLHLANGSTLNDKLAAEESRVSELMAAALSDAEMIDQAWLWCLSRMPSEDEKAQFLDLFASAGPDGKRLVVEDMFWSLMTSREFLFQH